MVNGWVRVVININIMDLPGLFQSCSNSKWQAINDITTPLCYLMLSNAAYENVHKKQMLENLSNRAHSRKNLANETDGNFYA